jgi:2'-5' RNA ligase
MRAFLAFALPGETKDEIAALLRALAPEVPGWKPAPPETIHLTLRFLGASTDAQVAAMRPALEAAARACPRGHAAIGPLGVFPERGAPRVLWLGAALPPGVLALQRACEAAAVAAGFGAEERAYTPHLTLGRFKDRVRRPDLPPVALGRFPLDALVLFESRLRPQGALHTPLERYPLSNDLGSDGQ